MRSFPEDDRRAALPPPRFRLGTMMLGVTALGIVFALMTALNAYGIFALLMLLLSIAAHVAGTALGTALRAAGDQPLPADVKMRAPAAVRYRRPAANEYAPASKLHDRASLGWPIVVLTSLGTIAGAIGGGYLVTLLYRDRTNLFNIGSGTLAFAVLAGIATFAALSFLQVLLSAIFQASRGR